MLCVPGQAHTRVDMTLQRPTGEAYHVNCLRHAYHEYDVAGNRTEQIPTQGFIGLEITETAPHTVKKVS